MMGKEQSSGGSIPLVKWIYFLENFFSQNRFTKLVLKRSSAAERIVMDERRELTEQFNG